MEYVVVGAGAIGGTVGARLARDGHDVLFCDADPEHVAAINESGLTLEGPVEQFRWPSGRAARGSARIVWIASCWRSRRTTPGQAMASVGPRLAEDGFVVSLQNGLNEPVIADAVGERRVVGAFVNFGADYLGPGRIFLRRPRHVPDRRAGRPSQRPGRCPRRLTSRTRRRAATCSAICGRSRPTGRCCSRRRSVRPVDRRCARRRRATGRCSPSSPRQVLDAAPLPAGAVRRFRPRRHRGLDRAAGRVQPAVGEDPLGHLPRPGCSPAAHGGGCHPRPGRPGRWCGAPPS